NYTKGQAVYVADASRAVGVVQTLLSAQSRVSVMESVRAEYAKVAEAHKRSEADKQRLPLAKARANAFKPDWASYEPPRPKFCGTRVFRSYETAELIPYVDWTPFFQTWELRGRYPAILDDPERGTAARQLFEDAQQMLARAVAEHWFDPKAVIGFWPANSAADDIKLYTGESRSSELAAFFTLRQQLLRRDGRPNLALADFIAPKETGKVDYLGAFVVTAGAQEDKVAGRFAKANDDYGSIMVKALADRIAEAFAERMHERVRREFWAYAPEECLTNEERIAEAYRGIRPAPGYPAQPDHTEKAALFRLLEAEKRIGVTLTESYAMWPGASVSGLYFAHPEAHYFGVAKVERDQVEDYARRKGMSIAEAERWLSPVLNYDPASFGEAAAAE
ncbi:MAG: methionine synthase, partial [Methylocapsa sp.]|nr:methionine synthase [Methylocapsa sp.]